MANITTTDSQYILDAIATGNVDLIKGIAETTVLTEEQIRAILFTGSLDVVKSMVQFLPAGSNLFAEITERGLTPEELENGKSVTVLNADGTVASAFTITGENCGEVITTTQDATVRYAKDNIARIILAINLDGLDTAALTLEDVITTIEKALLANTATPTNVVTPYLTDDLDAIRAAAFVHPNTDNATIVATMTAEDAAGTNIDGFKMAMIALLTTNEMIQSNSSIVAYLLGAGQNAPVRFAMFKNYATVVLNGGSVIEGVDTDALVADFVK